MVFMIFDGFRQLFGWYFDGRPHLKVPRFTGASQVRWNGMKREKTVQGDSEWRDLVSDGLWIE